MSSGSVFLWIRPRDADVSAIFSSFTGLKILSESNIILFHSFLLFCYYSAILSISAFLSLATLRYGDFNSQNSSRGTRLDGKLLELKSMYHRIAKKHRNKQKQVPVSEQPGFDAVARKMAAASRIMLCGPTTEQPVLLP